MIYREQYYIHRCPKCNADKVSQTRPQEKSNLHVGLELLGGFAEGWYGGDGSITQFVSDQFVDNRNAFICTKCGHSWNRPNIKDETPIHVLEQIKEEEIDKRRSKLNRLLIGAAIYFIIGLICYFNSTGIIKMIFFGFIGFACVLGEIILISRIVKTWNELNHYKSLHPEYLRTKF